ncbi:hypothetical protein RZS08_63655, partial [Arthrospira platensis SPKY1]|nr:hypothetical protein [Arthrospira platensis SPKY1]
FKELWVMNANGSNQQLVIDPPGQTDAWARGWSPDSTHISYTHINFLYYQGNWYWVNAYLDVTTVLGSSFRTSYGGRDWHMDWQTADINPPVSTMDRLPTQSTHEVLTRWSG